jgi:hypothetical protein
MKEKVELVTIRKIHTKDKSSIHPYHDIATYFATIYPAEGQLAASESSITFTSTSTFMSTLYVSELQSFANHFIDELIGNMIL